MTTWSDPYIGLPFAVQGRSLAGVDCWGLLYVVMAAEQRVAVPSYLDVDPAERREIGAILARDSRAYPWHPIGEAEARPFDVVLFRRGGLDDHVGVVVERGRMLHVEAGRESCIERFDGGKWRPRLVGFFRHAALMP